MKQLDLKSVYLDTKTKKPVVEFAKDQESIPVLQLSWKCDTCRAVQVHLMKKKAVYDEKDILSAIQATFNMAHYACGCDEAAKPV